MRVAELKEKGPCLFCISLVRCCTLSFHHTPDIVVFHSLCSHIFFPASRTGNKLFGKKDFPAALSAYTEAISLFSSLPASQRQEKGALVTTSIQLRTNRALAYIRLHQATSAGAGRPHGNLQAFRDAVEDCNWVLEREPENAKALFRRGLAFKGILINNRR